MSPDPEATPGSTHRANTPLVVHVGHDELVIRGRYETASIANDILIALWFIIGSILFFNPDAVTAGTWCFLLGSVELLVRPLIRLSRQVHLRRLRATASPPSETPLDF